MSGTTTNIYEKEDHSQVKSEVAVLKNAMDNVNKNMNDFDLRNTADHNAMRVLYKEGNDGIKQILKDSLEEIRRDKADKYTEDKIKDIESNITWIVRAIFGMIISIVVAVIIGFLTKKI